MPRPKRARCGRQPAPAKTETTTAAPPSPDAASSTTPPKQISPAQSDSSEKENRPVIRGSFLSRLGSAQQRRTLADATTRRDAALRTLEAEDVPTTSDSLDTWALGEDTTGLTGLLEGDRLRRHDMSGLDVDEDVFASMYPELDRPPSRGRSANTSTISAGQFARRSRAPSVISRDGGPIRPSSRGVNTPSVSSTFNFGQFRRRAREPSILGARRRSRRETLSDESDIDIDLEDDFAPDAVSTPLERRESRRAAPVSGEAAAGAPSGARTRKRKSSEMEKEDDARAASPVERDSQERQSVQSDQGGIEDDDVGRISDDSSLSSLSSPPRSLQSPRSPGADRGRPTTPVNMDEIMAPPASSGSDDGEWPSIRDLAKRRRRMSPSTPLQARDQDYASDISSPPSLTYSPNHDEPERGAKARGRSRAQREPSPSPLTAHLASLLPQRRARNVRGESDESGGEHDMSDLGDDEDELSYRQPRAGTRRASRSRPRSAGGIHSSAVKSRRTAPGSSRRVTRTYGGRSSEGDDSFGPLPDDSFVETVTPHEIDDPKQELKKAASKFKEVDKWELAFEDVTRSSSPLDAR